MSDEELPGILSLTLAVEKGDWPHTMDAAKWADEWLRCLSMAPDIATDRETMIGWFANAIMAGYDTANFRAGRNL